MLFCTGFHIAKMIYREFFKIIEWLLSCLVKTFLCLKSDSTTELDNDVYQFLDSEEGAESNDCP